MNGGGKVLPILSFVTEECDVEQRPEAEQANRPSDEYAAVASEIRSLGRDVMQSMLKVLLEVAKSSPGSTYIATRKYIEQKGLSASDCGNIGVTYNFLRGPHGSFIACPGDVIVYAQVDKARTDEILLMHHLDDKEVVQLYHARVLNFDLKGGIEVKSLSSGNVYWVSQAKILGKLVKVVGFGNPEWHELIGQMIESQLLKKRIIEELKWTEQNEFEDKFERVAELKRRIAILASGTR